MWEGISEEEIIIIKRDAPEKGENRANQKPEGVGSISLEWVYSLLEIWRG